MPASTHQNQPPILDVPSADDLGAAAPLVAAIVGTYVDAGARIAAEAAALGSAVALLRGGTTP